jgi:hypothetical protein
MLLSDPPLDLVIPARGAITVSLPGSSGTTRSLDRSLERAKEKLARLNEHWSKVDQRRVPAEARANHNRAIQTLEDLIKAHEK